MLDSQRLSSRTESPWLQYKRMTCRQASFSLSSDIWGSLHNSRSWKQLWSVYYRHFQKHNQCSCSILFPLMVEWSFCLSRLSTREPSSSFFFILQHLGYSWYYIISLLSLDILVVSMVNVTYQQQLIPLNTACFWGTQMYIERNYWVERFIICSLLSFCQTVLPCGLPVSLGMHANGSPWLPSTERCPTFEWFLWFRY